MEWRNRIIGYDTKPAAQFTPNPLNWRTHPSVQREALRGLLGDVGWVGAVLENKQTGNLIDGHARVKEALASDKDAPIPYLLVDLTPEEERLVLASFDPISALATADNKRLEELLKDVSSSSSAVDSMLAELAKEHGVLTSDEPKDAEPQIDKAEELRQKWGTETGQLWVIGNHRLLVGDTTNKADVGRVCADNKPPLMVTDPPYGLGGYAGRSGKKLAVVGDELDVRPLLESLPETEHRYIWCEWHTYPVFLETLGKPTSLIVWGKPWVGMGSGYRRQHEFCMYYGEFKSTNESDLWMVDYKSEGINSTWQRTEKHDTHPTQKPLECMARPIRNHLGDVYDPFVGSGTTLVAAENLNRKCYAIEISPAYVAVCLERMTTAFPHLKIEKVGQARVA